MHRFLKIHYFWQFRQVLASGQIFNLSSLIFLPHFSQIPYFPLLIFSKAKLISPKRVSKLNSIGSLVTYSSTSSAASSMAWLPVPPLCLGKMVSQSPLVVLSFWAKFPSSFSRAPFSDSSFSFKVVIS